MGEWFYIGHYGQIGPLTRESIKDLIDSGVILRETYVWKTGMSDWIAAASCAELAGDFNLVSPISVPPPPPGSTPKVASAVPNPSIAPVAPAYGMSPYDAQYPRVATVRSDKSRIAAGVLQLILPGVGRIYLGYTAIGVLQLVLTLCGIGYVWALIDGIIILTGGVKYDGYMRSLND